jgi:hypothetical protein
MPNSKFNADSWNKRLYSLYSPTADPPLNLRRLLQDFGIQALRRLLPLLPKALKQR